MTLARELGGAFVSGDDIAAITRVASTLNNNGGEQPKIRRAKLITCDRCKKVLERFDGSNRIQENLNGHYYDCCLDCFADYHRGVLKLEEEHRERGEKWLNEWLNNKPLSKENEDR